MVCPNELPAAVYFTPPLRLAQVGEVVVSTAPVP